MTEPPRPAFVLRPARREDVPAILALITELAVYERAPDAVEATEQHLHAALFPPEPTTARSHALIAEVEDPNAPTGQRIVAMAVWYVTFSTWVGRHGIWLEDLFVQPDQRGNGIGRALLSRLAEICLDRGYGRLEWWVLGWNESAIDFYHSLGAVAQDEWTVYRLDGDALAAVARLPR